MELIVDARPTRAGRRSPARPLVPVVAALLAILVAACSGSAATQAPTAVPTATVAPTPTPVAPFPVSLTDDEGTTVTIDAEPERIVSLTPAATETLFALGLGDRVVGRAADLTMYPPEAEPIPEVAVYDAVDVEQVVGLEPDLVIAGGNNFTKAEAIDQLRGLDLPVMVVYAPDIATV